MPSAPLQRSPFDLASVVVMVREPLSRLISSFMYSYHDLAYGNRGLVDEIEALGALRLRVTFFALHACAMQTRSLAGATSKRAAAHLPAQDTAWDPPAAFEAAAVMPSLGCTAAGFQRGLNLWRERQRAASSQGEHEAGASPDPNVALNTTLWASFAEERRLELRSWQASEGPRLVPHALARLREAAFVGVTGQWALSICVFYRAFGVPGHRVPGEAQLGKKRAQSSAADVREMAQVRQVLQEEGLDRDPMDDAVFAEGSRLLEESAARHGCDLPPP